MQNYKSYKNIGTARSTYFKVNEFVRYAYVIYSHGRVAI